MERHQRLGGSGFKKLEFALNEVMSVYQENWCVSRLGLVMMEQNGMELVGFLCFPLELLTK